MTATVDPDALMTAATGILDTVQESFISVLDEQRDQLVSAFAGVATRGSRTCLATSSGGEGCDRLPGHTGICSFDFDATVRRYRDFEEAAAKLPGVQATLVSTQGQLSAAQAELAQWRQKVPPGHT